MFLVLWAVLAAAPEIDMVEQAQLEELTLEKAEVISGITFAAGTKVQRKRRDAKTPWEIIQAELSAATKIQGMLVPAKSQARFAAGRLSELTLASELQIGEVLWSAGLIRFSSAGKVTSGGLARTTKFGGLTFPRGTFVFLSETGGLEMAELMEATQLGAVTCAPGRLLLFGPAQVRCVLARPHPLGDLTLPIGATFDFAPGGAPVQATIGDSTSLQFYEGKLLSAELGVPLEIAGLPFPAGTHVEFRAGRLESAKLGAPMKLGKLELPAHAKAEFKPDRSPWRIDLGGDPPELQFAGVWAITRDFIELHANGKLKQVTLARATEVQNTKLPKGAVVYLREDGSLDWLDINWVDGPVVLRELPCEKNAHVEFHPTGAFKSLELAGPATIQKVPCCPHEFVQFHPSGRLKKACVAQETELGGKRYSAGKWIELDEQGRVVQ